MCILHICWAEQVVDVVDRVIAMTEPDMDRLLLWLNHAKNPVFVLLPDTEFQRFKTPWQLPDLSLNK